jgi:hypothetical protein
LEAGLLAKKGWESIYVHTNIKQKMAKKLFRSRAKIDFFFNVIFYYGEELKN